MKRIVKKIGSHADRYLPNLIGWRTDRKIVVFSVDDYGNVRLASSQARDNLERAGVSAKNRFDVYDGLENQEDIEGLFNVLTQYTDNTSRHPVFTALTNPANLDFEAVLEDREHGYRYEPLYETYRKVHGSDVMMRLWQEGIGNRLLVPQLHGREHLNVPLFERILATGDASLEVNLQNRSLARLAHLSRKPLKYTSAYAFRDFGEMERLGRIAADGVDVFEDVFEYRPTQFNAPSKREHTMLHSALAHAGIRFLDQPSFKRELQPHGRSRVILNWTGKQNKYNQTYLVKNCSFEPTASSSQDAVNDCLKQIDSAFNCRKPAMIGSHRVNFTGVIEEENRRFGLDRLNELIDAIITRWPDVEFMTMDELGEMIRKDIS